jgi:magnesium transporter
MIGVTVGTSILLAILLAGVFGSAIPVALDRLGADPAIATGPFVTTAVDILAVLVYFNIARILVF